MTGNLARHLARLDEFGLLLIEQPLPEDDIIGHAQLAAAIETPICLDESIVSARSAADAIALGATPIVNVMTVAAFVIAFLALRVLGTV